MQEFIDAIAATGLIPPASVEADGRIHRFASDGRRGDDAGWYVLYADGIPAGAFGDWRTGIEQTWHKPGLKLDATAARAMEARLAEAKRQREEEMELKHRQARQRALDAWTGSDVGPPTLHPYLQRKGVKPYGIRERNGDLVIPLRDTDGVLHSLQTITEAGEKLFLPGGRVRGCYHSIGRPNGTILICEGYATGATLHDATGHAVAVAFNAGNLQPVAEAIHAKYPDKKIVICADDDVETPGNPGVTRAREAAAAVGGVMVIPEFSDAREGASDWNDLAAMSGIDEVRRQFSVVLSPKQIIDGGDVDWTRYAESDAITKVKPAATWMDEVIAAYYGDEPNPGALWPWSKFHDRGMRFRPSEVTVYAGESGSWKSMAQSQVAISLMSQGFKCLIVSLEMKPRKTLRRMVRQAAGTDQPTVAFMRAFKEWTNGKLWLLDHVGNLETWKALAVCRYARVELGATHVFLDSLLKFTAGMSGDRLLGEQARFASDICALAEETGVHVHLVAHTRKPQGSHRLTKHDVSGASELEKQVDQVILFDRVRDDAEERKPGELTLKDKDEPEIWIRVGKQREGDFEGSLPFHFNSKSLCIVESGGGSWCGVHLDIDRD